MTDGPLMEADCIHGCVWYNCDECCEFDPDDVARWEAEAAVLDALYPEGDAW